MFRALIYCESKSDRDFWQSHLGSEFEVAVATAEESLKLLFNSWRPHVLIFETVFNGDMNYEDTAVVVVAKFYNLKEEKLAYDNGVDHYFLVKTPIEVLRARLIHLAKKIESQRKLNDVPVLPTIIRLSGVIQYEDLQIDIDQKLLKQNDKTIHVTPTQFRLLMAFLSHPEQTLSREWLKDHAFHGKDISPRSIDAQIAKLKRTLPFLKTRLINLYGVGYILRSQNSKQAA